MPPAANSWARRRRAWAQLRRRRWRTPASRRCGPPDPSIMQVAGANVDGPSTAGARCPSESRRRMVRGNCVECFRHPYLSPYISANCPRGKQASARIFCAHRDLKCYPQDAVATRIRTRGSAAGQQAAALKPARARRAGGRCAAGGAAVGVRLVALGAGVAREADVADGGGGSTWSRSPSPTQTRPCACCWRLRWASSFSRKPVITPAMIGAPIAVADAPCVALVLPPQPLGRVQRGTRARTRRSRGSPACRRPRARCRACLRARATPAPRCTSTKKWSLRMLARMRSASVTRPVGVPRWRNA